MTGREDERKTEGEREKWREKRLDCYCHGRGFMLKTHTASFPFLPNSSKLLTDNFPLDEETSRWGLRWGACVCVSVCERGDASLSSHLPA